ncbi:histidine kinase [uncultured Leifsonia sp.]|uniref:sensor histidine kinase n=1 Tax=uncultured Leifsonia sp. TaxID=340359 RepID=UPI0028D7286E|nr:histidine kinase [uncultured Leifsonia sp.]
MRELLNRGRWLAEPVVAIVYFVLWAFAAVGTHQILPGMLRSVLPFWAFLLLLSVAIGCSRLQPVVAMSAATAALLLQLVLPSAAEPAIYLGFGIVVLIVSASVRGRWSVVALAFAVGAGVSIAGLLCYIYGIDRGEPALRPTLFIALPLLGAFLWLAGTYVGLRSRAREDQLALARTTAELERAEVEATVTEERERIAQDVHDIMAHSLSVILAQADGARFLADERPEAVPAALATIADAARTSLTEVRVLIETLVSDPDGHSTPALADLDELVQRLRDAGLAVEVERFGEVEGLTAAQELAAYRIVQEGLTNALKHGGRGASARVVIDARSPGLALSIASTGRAPVDPPQGGRGLHGMRERARLAGGWLEAGADDTPGGFLVTGYIPAGVPA